MHSHNPFTVLNDLSSVPAELKKSVVAIGNFDGMHRGHQAVFAKALASARALNVPAVVLTFEPHPKDVFAPEPHIFRLTPAADKARIAEALGFDGIVIMPFSRDLSSVSPEDFIQSYLVDALDVSAVAIGSDFHFGKNRAGTPEFLIKSGAQLGFSVQTIQMLSCDDTKVSSTRIRDALRVGDVKVANDLLGYHYTLTGIVELGDQRGRTLGFPTANIPMAANCDLMQGVYAVTVLLDGQMYGGVAAYGKPMFNNTMPPFETHIFDFDEDIYGKTISVALLDFIRGQEKFDGLDALIAAMQRDKEIARITIARANPLSELDATLGFVKG